MTTTPSSAPEKRSKLGDTIFAVVHLLLLTAILIYAVIALVQRNTTRFVIIMVGLVLYYFLVLHKAVLKEIGRKRKLKSAKSSRRP